MHTSSNEFGENFYKNANVQINVTAAERFQIQNKNDLTVENNTYKDITLNQMQREEHWNEEYSNIKM